MLSERPSARDIADCRGWLEAERAVVSPSVVVCLGATAAQAFLGPGFRMNRGRGLVQRTPDIAALVATWHPAAILRAPASAARLRGEFVDDLRRAKACAEDVRL
jgi:DNA polymerase